MKYFILSIAFVIASCSSPKTDKLENTDSAKDTLKQNPVHAYKAISRLTCLGDFNGDGQLDTLFQNNISQLNNLPIDSVPDNDWDAVVRYLSQQEANVIITSSITSVDTLQLGTAQGLYCLINIGDNNGDKRDEVALVVDVCDYSNINTCEIFSLCEKEWTLLNNFEINEGAFVFRGKEKPIFKSIPGFLENEKGQWRYTDYDKEDLHSSTGYKVENIAVKDCRQ